MTAGREFILENGGRAGIRFRERRRQRWRYRPIS